MHQCFCSAPFSPDDTQLSEREREPQHLVQTLTGFLCLLCRGAYFLEAWSNDGQSFSNKIYYFDGNVPGDYVDPPWFLKFPPGRHSSGKALPNGIICTSPWDTGTVV